MLGGSPTINKNTFTYLSHQQPHQAKKTPINISDN